MDIGTTMVHFQLTQEQLNTRTDKAVLIELAKSENGKEEIKEWVPLSKIEFEQCDNDPTKYDVIMPKWLFYKKEVLPLRIKVLSEFVVNTYANKYELLATARKQTTNDIQ